MSLFTLNAHTLQAAALSSCMFSGAALLTGCSPSTDTNNTAADAPTNTPTTQTETSKPADTQTNTQKTPTDGGSTEQNTDKVATSYDSEVVNPTGYKTLKIGQTITPEIREQFGATEPDTGDETCYYISDPALTYEDKDFGKRSSVLYQIIDGKLALIHVQGSNAPFYTGVRVGDSVDTVMTTHDGRLDYEVDHYAQDGDYYNLLANVNFTVVNPKTDGGVLTMDDVKMNNSADTLPIQIEYHIKNGQKLSQNTIAADSWSAEDKEQLVGEVDSIDIGIPEAIYLIEGCS